VEQAVDTLPEGKPVRGVALLAGELYLLREKERDQVEVYDIITFRLLFNLTVPNAGRFTDMTSCKHCHCVYICDDIGECVHRLDVQFAVTQWAVKDKPWSLSLNMASNLLVTCPRVRKIKEFSSCGNIVREIQLSDDIVNPCHAIQTRSGQFIVCHTLRDDPVHRVCMLSSYSDQMVHSHGGQRGPDTGKYDVPFHLAVDENEFVFVTDSYNCRVTLLSPMLQYVCQVVSRDQLKGRPERLLVDAEQRLLYVTVNEWKIDELKGHLEVFNV